ncbi:MAG TPA: cytochrome c biogenesis protein ResB, partial [Spirochaetia bacterium]|nr:cytochrome c biogenesis protein ResB [Spirochaetia bacterium]
RFFKSVRLTIVLILVIAVLSLLASLVPQGRSDSWYRSHYSPFLGSLILLADLPRFFRSAGFLVPALFLTLNLGVCAVDRVVRRVRDKARPRYGPDLVHLGLLILIAGGVITALGRQETTWSLAVGEDAALDSTYALHLLSLQYLKYDNGAPKEWTSTVRVTRSGSVEIPSFPIRVNQPLRLKGLSVYQTAWELQGILDLKDADGQELTATTGQGFPSGQSFWYFAEAQKARDAWSIVAVEYDGREMKPVSTRELRTGDTLGPYTVLGVTAREVTGLKAVKDPGFAPFLGALVTLAAGLCLTFIQRRGEAVT